MLLGTLIDTLGLMPREYPVRAEATKEAPLRFVQSGSKLALEYDFRATTTVGTLIRMAVEIQGHTFRNAREGHLEVTRDTEIERLNEAEELALEVILR